MKEQIKKIELREDGFLEIQLKRAKDFDDYLFQQIQQDATCLPCARDYRFKTKLYYDTKGYIRLLDYLQDHIFDAEELLSFLIYFLEYLVKVNASKPIVFLLEYMYLCADASFARFLVIPIIQDNWMLQKEESNEFLQYLIKEIKAIHAYEVIGYLVESLKEQDIQLPQILQGLHKLKKEKEKKQPWFWSLFHQREEPSFHVQGLPQPVSYPQFPYELHVQEQGDFHAYAKDEIQNDIEDKQTLKKDSHINKTNMQDRMQVKEEDKEDKVSLSLIKKKRRKQSHQYIDKKESIESQEEVSKAQDLTLHETVVLFPTTQRSYLLDVETKEKQYITSGVFSIGRNPDNTYVIAHASISAYHAMIDIQQGIIEDLHSSNGTFVNDKRIQKKKLEHLDNIRFADKEFQYYHQA